LLEELRELAVSAGVVDRTIFGGEVGNIGDWYESADVFVLSSRREGFPMVLVEAMANGLPAVSFDCDTGPRDIIRHEVDGLLVPPQDTVKLAEAMARVMGDAALRKRMAARAIEVRDRFSMARIGAMWDDLFRSLGANVDA
jgi:glycosyltransferase involved in cell wall biosynthesis